MSVNDNASYPHGHPGEVQFEEWMKTNYQRVPGDPKNTVSSDELLLNILKDTTRGTTEIVTFTILIDPIQKTREIRMLTKYK